MITQGVSKRKALFSKVMDTDVLILKHMAENEVLHTKLIMFTSVQHVALDAQHTYVLETT